MALKFRRGTTAQKSGSLAFGEPFINTDLNTLQIGGLSGDITLGTTGESSAFAGVSVSASSFISGSALKITGNAVIDGNLTLGGAITIGDASSDIVNVVASLSSSLIPSETNVFNLGSSDKIWKDLYISTGSIKFVAGNTVVGTLSSNANGDIIGPEFRIKSGSNPQLVFENEALSAEYHIQYGNGGNFTIHNPTNGRTAILFESSSLTNHPKTYLYDDLSVSKSISSAEILTNNIVGNHITGSLRDFTIGSLTTYSSSVNTRLISVEGVSASAASALNNVSGAFATTVSTLGSSYATDAELSAVSSAVAVRDAAQDVLITSLRNNVVSASVFTTFSTSVDSRLDSVELVSASAAGALNSVSGAFNTTISNLGSTYATDAELSSLSSSVATRNAGQDTTISTLSSSVDSRLDVVEGVSASAASALNSLSSSAFSAYAKVGSANTFNGNQTISGSLIVTQDLVIGGSASIQHVTSSQLNISDNIITVNTINPTVRFGGLAIIDSGSAGISGSFLYDSVQDEFVFVHKGDGTNITSSHFLVGPETYNDLGNETYLSANKVLKSKGNEHLVESNITDNGTTITLGSNTSVTGTLVATGTSLVSASAQITLSSTTGYSTFSSSVATTIANLGGTYATDAELSAVSGAFATTVSNLGSTYATDAELSAVSSAVATTISNLGNTYATDSELSTVSGAFVTTIENLGNTYATDAELSAVSSAVATRTAGIDTTINTLSSSVNTRLVTLEGKDISVTLTGDVTGTGTITDLGNVSFATTIAANSVALGTDTTGNYIASLVAGTNITLSNNSGEGATPTIGLTNNAITIAGTSTSLGGTITAATILGGTGVVSGSAQIDVSSTTGDIALGTRTSGNYVATITAGTGVSSTGATTGEGIAHTISIGQAVATSSNVQFNSLGIGMAASATAGRIDATNDIVAFSSSDIRFKENIRPIENAIDKIRKISGNTYDWKEENKIEHGYEGNDVGVIAQEIEAVLPQLVQTRESGYKAVKYDKLVALLIEGIKEQQLQIEQLRIDLDNCRNKGL